MWHLTACKISVSLSFLSWIKIEIIFYRIFELMLETLIQRYDKKSFHFKKRLVLAISLNYILKKMIFKLFLPYKSIDANLTLL